jgi:predicted metal-dependent peptidase
LNYRAVLRQFRASVLSIHRRLTRMKPNRRYGFAYMGSRYEFTTRLLFAVDVSGSMSAADLALGFSVVNRFFKYGVERIDVLQFDTEIKGDPVLLKRARRTIAVSGRGGTSFAPVMRFLDEHREYDGAIVFTDGIAPVPPRPTNRRTRVLWLFTNEETYRRRHEALRAIGRATFLKEARA